VRVGEGAEHLPPPGEREAKVLERIGAPAGVRLACQIRPLRDLEVTPLLPPTAGAREGFRRPRWLAGEEREIAVLFADMRGFTRLADQRLPYDTVFVLNRWFAMLGRAVEESEGRLDKFIGDGVMALFGVERGPAEGARRALDCAARMADGLDALNEALAAELPFPLAIGIGVHVGPAIVGEMGWGGAKALTAIGDAVNTASRLETLTKEFGCQLVLSDALARAAALDTGALARHETPIRGKAMPITVYAAADARDLTGGGGNHRDTEAQTNAGSA
jgi:adenylate cyclase